MILQYLLIFLAYVVLDVVWARYTIDLSRKHNLALLWAPMIPGLGGYVVIEYTQDHLMLVPVMFAAVVGTWLGMHGEWVLAVLRARWSRLFQK